MAHFAEIHPQTHQVLRVLVVPNEEEYRGQQFLANDLCLGGTWIQCSYNGTIRKNYPGPGFTYDSVRDAFIPPRPPGEGWLFDEETCRWYKPVTQ